MAKSTSKKTSKAASKEAALKDREALSHLSLRRLALKSGAPTLGKPAAVRMREAFYKHAEELLRHIVVETAHNGLRTIKSDAVRAAIASTTGQRIYA